MNCGTGGCVALVTQPADIGAGLISAPREMGFAFGRVFGLGEGSALSVADCVAELTEDPGTRVIAVSVDDLADGHALVGALERARRGGKQLVALKPGDDPVWRAVLEECGAIAADSYRELVDIAFLLDRVATAGRPAGNRAVVLAGGGGGGIIATDLCAHYGLEVPRLTDRTLELLSPLVPPIASMVNPIDFTPEMWQPRWFPNFPAVLDLIAADPNIDIVFIPSLFMNRDAAEMGEAVAEFCLRTKKTVLISWTFMRKQALDVLAQKGIYTFLEPARALKAVAKVLENAPLPPERQPRNAPAPHVGAFPQRIAEAAGFTVGNLNEALAGSQAPLRVTAFRDPVFGPMAGAGAGAHFAQVLDDFKLKLAPFDAAAALAMLERLKIVKHALRMEPGANLTAAAEALAKLSQLIAAPACPAMSVTLDPVWLTPGGPIALRGETKHQDH